jgi:hypothetical protein
MPNLIDKLTAKVDTVRQKAADKFGLPAHDMYRVMRTYSSGEIGNGPYTDVATLITPTPKVEFKGNLTQSPMGLFDERTMSASQISLTFNESFLRGLPRSAGQECFYKLVERNSQGAATTYWQLTAIPTAQRSAINWVLEFKAYSVC